MLTRFFLPRQKVRVGEVLLQRGLITSTQLQQALAEQRQSHEKLGAILIRQEVVTEAQLRQALNEQAWRNAVATVLFSVSALVSHLPKAAVTVPSVQTATQASASQEDDPIGGAVPLGNTPPAHTARLQGFCHPMRGVGRLSQGNGGGTHRGRMHYAYDFASPIGTPVYAMRSGRVVGLEDRYPDTGGGREKVSQFNYVFLEHSNGYRSAYIHLQQGFRRTVRLVAGAWVNAGDLIGYSGNSGWSNGPHLHVEVQQPGYSRRFTSTVPFAMSHSCNRVAARR